MVSRLSWPGKVKYFWETNVIFRSQIYCWMRGINPILKVFSNKIPCLESALFDSFKLLG